MQYVIRQDWLDENNRLSKVAFFLSDEERLRLLNETPEISLMPGWHGIMNVSQPVYDQILARTANGHSGLFFSRESFIRFLEERNENLFI